MSEKTLKKKIVGFQTDEITTKILELKEQEAKSLGRDFNKSEYIRKAICLAALDTK